MFDTPERLVLGLVTGFLFGFLLQKSRVSNFAVIVGQFLLREFTMLKVMLTAIVTGGVGVYILIALGYASLHIKPLLLAGVMLGGVVFGIGMVILGYCPGTGVAAMAEGSRHAIAGVCGMLAGAALYAEIYPALSEGLLKAGDFGGPTLSTATGISPWIFLALLLVISLALFRFLERRDKRADGKERHAV